MKSMFKMDDTIRAESIFKYYSEKNEKIEEVKALRHFKIIY